MKKGTVDQEIN